MNILPGYRFCIITLIIGAVFWLCLHPLQELQFGAQSDEGYYLAYASDVQHKGLPAFKDLLSWYSSSDEALKHPTPMRAGYIIFIASLFNIFGPSFYILGLCSTLSFLLFLAICFYFVRKHFDLDTALIFVLLLVSSPLMLGLSRRALLDSPLNLLWGIMAWLFLDLLLKPESWKYVLFILTLALSITVKEMSIILIPFFVIAALWIKPKGENLSKVQIAGIVIGPILLVTSFYLWVLGGFSSLIMVVNSLVRTHLYSHCTNFYAVGYSSGPWFRYILDFLLVNPIVTLLFVGYVGYLCLQRREMDIKRRYFLMYFVFIYVLLNSLPHSKVLRFVVNLEMVITLFAVLMIQELAKRVDFKKYQRWIIYMVLGIFAYNWRSFLELFYFPSLLDPISHHLLLLRHFIPY